MVTGAGGFIGRHVVSALRARGVHVIATGRNCIDGLAFDLLTCDPAELIAAAAPTHVVHLSWSTAHPSFWTDRQNIDWLGASARLLRASFDAGVRRFVAAGTCTEYAWPCAACDEIETPVLPTTLYGSAKDAFRRVAEAYARQTQRQFAWGRVFFAYGPGEPTGKLVTSTLTTLLAGQTPRIRDAARRLDFVYVEDVGRAFAQLALADGAVGSFNIASGTTHAVADVAQAAALAVDPHCTWPVETQHPSDMIVGADISRVSRLAGFTPSVTLSDGLERMVTALRAS